MAPLCSYTGLVGPIPKGRWRLSWTNRRYGRNVSSLIRTKLEKPIKWMEASRFSSSKENKPYTKCCGGDVQCGVWHWRVLHADDKRCLLTHAVLSVDPIWVHAITISSLKWKNRREGPGTTKRWTYPCYKAVNMEHQQKWTRWWHGSRIGYETKGFSRATRKRSLA